MSKTVSRSLLSSFILLLMSAAVAQAWLADLDAPSIGLPIVSLESHAGEDDTTPPVLSSLSISPSAVDVSGGASTITITATITDDLAGVATSGQCAGGYASSPVQIRFRSPSGGQFQDGLAAPLGDDLYAFPVTVPQHAEQGIWTVAYVLLVDCLGNIQYRYESDLAADHYPTSFEVTSPGDTTPPVLSSLSISPSAVDVSGGASTITVTATITDNLVGVATSGQCAGGYTSSPVQIRFRSPSGGQVQDGLAAPLGDDLYAFPVTVRQYAEQGTWTVAHLLLVDCLGNLHYRYPVDLAVDGYPTSFEVQPAPPTFAVDAVAWTLGADGGSTVVAITSTSPFASWTGTSASDWLGISPPTGLGDGDVTLTASVNLTSSPRTATANVAGHAIAVSQAVGATTLALTSAASAGVYSGETTLQVQWMTTSGSGNATFASDSAWLTVECGTGGTPDIVGANSCTTQNGRGIYGRNVAVAATPSANPRSGTISVTGLDGGNTVAVTVTQAGSPATFTVTPASWNAPAGGGSQAVTVTSSHADASWTATSEAAWLTVSGSGGTGSGSITLSAAANTGSSPRSTTATIAGQAIAVNQSLGVTTVVLVSPELLNAPPSANTFLVEWTTATGSGNATISSASNWLTVQCGTGGTPDVVGENACTTQNGRGAYGRSVSVAATPSANPRSAAVTVTGADGGNAITVIVTQSGSPATFTVTPTAWDAPAGGGSQLITVTSSLPDASWTGGTGAAWLNVSDSGGTGNGNVTLVAVANTTSSVRSTTATIAGHTVAVTQGVGATTVTLTSASSVSSVPTATSFLVGWTTATGSGNVTVASTSSWLTVQCGTGGTPDIPIANGCTTQNGRGNYSRYVQVAVASSTNSRVGTVTITGANGGNTLTVTITQAGGTATFTVTPASWNAPAGGGSHDVTVTSSVTDGPWMSSSNAPWLSARPVGEEWLVSTLAGSTPGFADGTGWQAQFLEPTGLVFDGDQRLYLADRSNHRIRQIAVSGEVTTIAGGIEGYQDGLAAEARFRFPSAVGVDGFGNVYVADTGNFRIRRISRAGVVTTVAGSEPGFVDGLGAVARFGELQDMTVSHDGTIYVADNMRIRRVDSDGNVTTMTPDRNAHCIGARCYTYPQALGLDKNSQLYIAWGDGLQAWLETMSPEGELTQVRRADGGLVTFGGPAEGLAVASSGVVYVSAGGLYHQVKDSDGIVVPTVLLAGFADGLSQHARFSSPSGLAIDGAGRLLVADRGNHRIRVIRPAGSGTVVLTADANDSSESRTATATIAGVSVRVTQNAPSVMALNHTALRYSAVHTGYSFASVTGTQPVRLSQTGVEPVGWTAQSDQPWLTVSPASGAGPATLAIGAQYSAGLPMAGTTTGTITLVFTGAAQSNANVTVALRTIPIGGSSPPIGIFDTPAHNTTGVTGSIAVTGWALDDVEVTRVRILRSTELGTCFNPVYIGDAVLVDGARPDVAGLYGTYPRNTRAGWGYMMLTNFLPNLGNGTFTLCAIADDVEGGSTLLGVKTITVANSQATKPFGAIDTPAQGQTISGTSFHNFGWVLSPPDQGRADPPGGGTVNVFINDTPVGVPVGWTSRSDITTLFPSTQFGEGVASAAGVYTFNPQALGEGVHTIAWSVINSLGASDGIGSRYFTVTGSGPSSSVTSGTALSLAAPAMMAPLGSRGGAASLQMDVGSAPNEVRELLARRGYDTAAPFRRVEPDGQGRQVLNAEELDRIELRIGRHYTGYMRVGDGLGPLPIGSRLNPETGVFGWQPGVGFIGSYDLVFVRWGDGRAISRQEVRIVLHPKGGNLVGPQVMIDYPSTGIDVARRFTIAGWALDRDDDVGTGVDAVHVWAYAADGAAPIFLGAATYGGLRPDVAGLHGERYGPSGYGLFVEDLEPGHYDLAVFAFSTARNAFAPAKVVRVTVR